MTGEKDILGNDTKVPPGIAAKLVKIMSAVATVEKKGKNRAQNYDFVRETDLVEKVRPLMAAEGLFLNLSVVDHELIEMGKTSSGSTQRLTILTINGTWIDAKTGDMWPLPMNFVGYGADTGDKGVYKAMTGAEKYLLFKSFLVGTGDDPEADERTDRNPVVSRRGPSAPTRVVNANPDEDVARGGRSAKATVAQLRRIAGLVTETGIGSDALRRLISRETGLIPPDGPMNRWLSDQTAGVAGKIIGSLTTLTNVEEEGQEDTERDYGNSNDDLPLV